ncbi:MAG: hypothetical protein ABIT05_11745 [Chitinophagaceae bacterium]
MKYSLLFLLVVSIGCVKEKVGHTSSFIKNSTSHKIILLPYNGTTLDNSTIKVINPNSTVEVYNDNVRGKTIEPGFGTLLQPYDSVVVSYDDTIKIPHIKFNILYNGSHKVLFTSNRSISNQNNWVKTITNETKYSLEGNFMYTFVEQDYLDAK